MATELATFGGGCFWCTESIFKRLKGVISVTSGYSGGTTDNPNWESVHTGTTGHAESIQIEFDPSIIPFEKLLDIFWYSHNPTTLNQQGADKGTQYRSAIFYHNDKQKEIAEKSKEEFAHSGKYQDPLVTEITPFTNFYPAEAEQQNFEEKYSNSPYCFLVIDPKIQKLMKEYGNDVKEEYK